MIIKSRSMTDVLTDAAALRVASVAAKAEFVANYVGILLDANYWYTRAFAGLGAAGGVDEAAARFGVARRYYYNRARWYDQKAGYMRSLAAEAGLLATVQNAYHAAYKTGMTQPSYDQGVE